MGYARAHLETRDDQPTEDHIVLFDGATWADYERLLEVRGERATPRITYLKGILEIMAPSVDHEFIKSIIGRLVDTYCLWAGVRFTPAGSWTLKNREEERALEPDECYVFGDTKRLDRPHLAIEVVWTSRRPRQAGGLSQAGSRRGLDLAPGSYQVHALRGDRYEPIERSEVLPNLDLDPLVRFLDRPTAYDAMTDFRAALESGGA